MQKPLGQYRAVDVAIDKVHQHFGARAGGEKGAPVRATPPGERDAHAAIAACANDSLGLREIC